MLNLKSTENLVKPNSRLRGGVTVKQIWFKILASTVYRRVLLLQRRLDGPIPMIFSRIDVTIDCLSITHMAEYLQLQPDAQESEIHDRFGNGHTCFSARYEGRLIAVAWATPHRIHMSYVSLVTPLPVNSIYFYESFTETSCRGLSIQSALCTHMMRYFSAKGFQRVITGVVPENGPSRRKNEKCGFKPFQMIRCVMLGPYRRLLPAALYMHDRYDNDR